MTTLDHEDIASPAPDVSNPELAQTQQHLLPEAMAPSSNDPAASASSGWAWVPVRSMSPRHRPRILDHLLALDQHDRYLRFGHPATDLQIGRYVETLDFARDELFGIFNRKLELIALAHLAYSPAPQIADQPAMAEFGVSVLPKARRRHFGRRLFNNAILHARNRGIDTLFIHALSENTAMLKIARKAGAEVVRDGSESEAWLQLPPDTVVSRIDEVVEHRAAEIDYQWKRHTHRVQTIFESLSELRPPSPVNDQPGSD